MADSRNILQNGEVTTVTPGRHKMYVVDTQDTTQSEQGSGKYIDVGLMVTLADGTERFATLAEVNALTTKSTTVQYVVDSDGDNNGFYTWDGTSAMVDYNRDLGAVIETEVESTTNLAKDEFLVYDKVIASNGQLVDGVGWVLLKIPIETGVSYTFGNFTMIGAGWSSFLTENEALVQFNGVHANNNEPLPKTFSTSSTTAKFLYIDIARPDTDPSLWSEVTVNEGATLLPYEDPNIETVELVTKINGLDIKGTGEGNGFNDGDNLNVGVLAVQGLQLDLPSGTTEPAGVQVGDMWIDTTDPVNGKPVIKLS